MPSTENLTTLSNFDEQYIVVFVFKSVIVMLKNIAFFLNMFWEEETLGINGNGEYNQQFHGFKVWMDPILKFVRSKY